jgi:dihydropteroate synthase
MFSQSARFAAMPPPLWMAVLNVTPDSFSDGGRFRQLDVLLEQAAAQLGAGATVLDVGGESTRPGARTLPAQQEAQRLLPALAALRKAHPEAVLSVDTRKADVAEQALALGVQWVNDVSGLRFAGERMARLVADAGATLVLTHSLGSPATMQLAPSYGPEGVVEAVYRSLASQCDQALAWGIAPQHLWVDVGFGFGKTTAHNVALLKGLGRFMALGYPLLVGVSRKGSLAALSGADVPAHQRDTLTALAHVPAFAVGAHGYRVHDVALHKPCWQAWQAWQQG